MKHISRMFVFSAVALIVTSLWNKGFSIPIDTTTFPVIVIFVAILSYIIKPITKLILLPLNLITFGLVSLAVYCLLFYIIASQFQNVHINSWKFDGFTFTGLTIPNLVISRVQNIALSSLSVSVIINMLEKII